MNHSRSDTRSAQADGSHASGSTSGRGPVDAPNAAPMQEAFATTAWGGMWLSLAIGVSIAIAVLNVALATGLSASSDTVFGAEALIGCIAAEVILRKMWRRRLLVSERLPVGILWLWIPACLYVMIAHPFQKPNDGGYSSPGSVPTESTDPARVAVLEEPPCRDEGVARAVAHAYLLSNPLWDSQFFLSIAKDTLAPFVERNAALFQEGGAAVRCARALGRAIVGRAINTYDPRDAERAAVIASSNGLPEFAAPVARDLGAPAGALFQEGLELQWLAEVLPAFARGDRRSYETTGSIFRQQIKQAVPFLELQMQVIAAQDPAFAASLFQYMIPAMGMSLEQSEQSIVLLARNFR